MFVVTVAYILMATSLTLMIPFTEVNPVSAFADAFAQVRTCVQPGHMHTG
jgi:hypothetical protein